MPRDIVKGHAALRRGRWSGAGAEYFLTLCTAGRNPGLIGADCIAAIMTEASFMERDGTWRLRCLVMMPDHIHLLVVLGGRLALGKAVARLKAKTTTGRRRAHPDLKWARDFFDHRVRADEDHLSLFLCIFLNPYRAQLCVLSESWPGYHCSDEDWRWFRHELDNERPPPEWLA